MIRSPALALLLVLLGIPAAQAEWVRGTGQALVLNGDAETARELAHRRALRNASLQFEARVASEETLENGRLTHSRLTVASQSRASRVRVLSEEQQGGRIRVTLEADMHAGRACTAGDAAHLRKRVAVTGFSLAERQDAALGRLADVEATLPAMLVANLRQSARVQVFSATGHHVYRDLADAPTRAEKDRRLGKTLDVARDLGAQFVVSGVIRDMSVTTPEAWGSALWQKAARSFGLANRDRRFVLDLFVHEGFSGQPVMERRYAVVAPWDVDRDLNLRVASAGFLETAYGQAVTGLVKEAANEIAAELACQPYMVRIERVEDRQVYLAAGAGSGLRPGDRLRLYRKHQFLDSARGHYELEPLDTQMQISQVFPEFSRGRIGIEAGRLNLQRDDVAIALGKR